ncbi:MAG: F0F1 ATP synthase subunit epsilon [Acidobacteria bacterium]|nr:F0F1 ATP synthase subunit epsilon [Acidobacteriota bacterium]MBI3655824.1 F0F1 ATP synthase subunit epsilon [Acidobacteriota bacterium]
MLPEKFFLEIVTPSQLLYSGNVTEATVPGLAGYMGILPGHAPLISELTIGEISFVEQASRRKHHMFCAWGFCEVLPEQVSVLAQIAERAEDIDLSRAESAKARAEQRLNAKDPDTDFKRVQLALARALHRIQLAKKSNR